MALRPNPNEKLELLKKQAAHARMPWDKDAWLNVSFYHGEQYSEWNSDANFIRRIPRTPKTRHSPRPVVNKIKHLVSQQHAFALQARPTVDALPTTDDLVDASDAQVALSYCEHIASPLVANFERRDSEQTLWALTAGEGYLKWVWNPKYKRPDIVLCSPFDVYVDPYAVDFYRARYIIHSVFMDPEQVYDAYGIALKPDQTETQDDVKAALLREMGQAPVVRGVTVNELWMRPSRKYPKGRYAVWAGREQLVEPTDLPYEHLISTDALPFTQIGTLPRPGSMHYDSMVKDGRSPQMELNKYHAQRIKIRENFANPKWWLDSDLELEQDPDDSPNQILRGDSKNGTLRPEIIQAEAMADNNEGEWIGTELMHVWGLHEVSQGQVPGRVEAAKAIEMLKQSDADRLSELESTKSTAIAQGFWHIAMLGREFEQEEVLVRSYTREGVPEVKRFKGGKVDPGLRFEVTMGDGLGHSRAAREDRLQRLWDAGILRDPEVMLQKMDVPRGHNLLSSRAFDIQAARNENYDMADGTARTPNSWDDHEIHLREHNNYRKTAEFRMADQGAKERFEFHCQSHEDLQVQVLAKLLQKQQLVAALAAGSGEEPQPGSEGGASNVAADTGGGTAGQTPPGGAADETPA